MAFCGLLGWALGPRNLMKIRAFGRRKRLPAVGSRWSFGPLSGNKNGRVENKRLGPQPLLLSGPMGLGSRPGWMLCGTESIGSKNHSGTHSGQAEAPGHCSVLHEVSRALGPSQQTTEDGRQFRRAVPVAMPARAARLMRVLTAWPSYATAARGLAPGGANVVSPQPSGRFMRTRTADAPGAGPR